MEKSFGHSFDGPHRVSDCARAGVRLEPNPPDQSLVKSHFEFSKGKTRGKNRYARNSFAASLADFCRSDWNSFHHCCWCGRFFESLDHPIRRERRVSQNNGKRNRKRSAFSARSLRANPAHRFLDGAKREFPSKRWRKSNEVDRGWRYRGEARSVGGVCPVLAA